MVVFVSSIEWRYSGSQDQRFKGAVDDDKGDE